MILHSTPHTLSKSTVWCRSFKRTGKKEKTLVTLHWWCEKSLTVIQYFIYLCQMNECPKVVGIWEAFSCFLSHTYYRIKFCNSHSSHCYSFLSFLWNSRGKMWIEKFDPLKRISLLVLTHAHCTESSEKTTACLLSWFPFQVPKDKFHGTQVPQPDSGKNKRRKSISFSLWATKRSRSCSSPAES